MSELTAEELERRLLERGVPVSPAKLVSEKNVAVHRVLECRLRTLQDMRYKRTGPQPTQLNGRYFYSVAALAEFINACTAPQPGATRRKGPQTPRT